MKTRAERALEMAAQWPLTEDQASMLADINTMIESMPPDRDNFLAGVCVALGCVKAMDCGVTWKEIVKTAGEDELIRFASVAEPEEWELAGFSQYAEAELGRRKMRDAAAEGAEG